MHVPGILAVKEAATRAAARHAHARRVATTGTISRPEKSLEHRPHQKSEADTATSRSSYAHTPSMQSHSSGDWHE